MAGHVGVWRRVLFVSAARDGRWDLVLPVVELLSETGYLVQGVLFFWTIDSVDARVYSRLELSEADDVYKSGHGCCAGALL